MGMHKQRAIKKGLGLKGKLVDFESALGSVSGALYDLLVRNPVDLDKVTIKHRGEADWLVIIRKYDDDGAPVVIFGFGFDLSAALHNVGQAINADKWKVDKPYRPNGS